MSSLKRYRQTSDNNATSRAKDIPPRFKRQKSITAPSSPTGMNSDTEKQSNNQTPKTDTWGGFLTPSWSHSAHKSNSTMNHKGANSGKKNATGRPLLAVDRNTSRATKPIVLSPIDNKFFNFVRDDQQTWHSPSQAFCNDNQNQQRRQQGSPPLQNINNDWGQHLHRKSNKKSIDSQRHKGNYSITQENVARQSPSPAAKTDQISAYSDPDLRTIEMLRELERLADQNEKEEEENGTNRKHLVSHHLRMLMCAVDKYTEGIEDEVEQPIRGDEVFSEETCAAENRQPSVSSCYTHVAQQQSLQSNINSNALFWTSDKQSPRKSTEWLQKSQMHYNFNDDPHHKAIHAKIHDSPPISPSATLNACWQNIASMPQMVPSQSWDPWHSPCFNVLDVYTNFPSSDNPSEVADSAFVLFDQLGHSNESYPSIEEYNNRTPLYQR